MAQLKHRFGDKKCPLCFEKLGTCKPILTELFLEIQNLDPDAHISWGHRGMFDQMMAKIRGKSNAVFGESPHNSFDESGNPASDAIDIFFLINQMKIYEDKSNLRFIKLWANLPIAIKAKFTWGGNFKTFKGDVGHFEIAGWGAHKGIGLPSTKAPEDQL